MGTAIDTVLLRVMFQFPNGRAPGASQVSVVGSFNGWDPATHRLTRTHGGDWSTTIFLPAGRAVYCFWVDGTMWLDQDDEGRMPNAWGSEYSVRYIRPAWPSSALDTRRSLR